VWVFWKVLFWSIVISRVSKCMGSKLRAESTCCGAWFDPWYSDFPPSDMGINWCTTPGCYSQIRAPSECLTCTHECRATRIVFVWVRNLWHRITVKIWNQSHLYSTNHSAQPIRMLGMVRQGHHMAQKCNYMYFPLKSPYKKDTNAATNDSIWAVDHLFEDMVWRFHQ